MILVVYPQLVEIHAVLNYGRGSDGSEPNAQTENLNKKHLKEYCKERSVKEHEKHRISDIQPYTRRCT